MCSNNVPVSHCKDITIFDITNNFIKNEGKEIGHPISPSNPNQNTEQHCGFDQQASEHGRKNVLPVEACAVNQLLDEGEDEHADSPSERKEQHSPMRHLMRLEYHGNGNKCAGESSDAEVSPLVCSPSGEKGLEIIE